MEGIYTTGFIPVTPNTTYYKGISDSARFKFYNKNKESISNSYTDLTNAGNAQAFVTTENAFYIRLSITTSYLATFQFEQNTVATEYETYVEDKIFVKNDNDVYAEFKEENKKLEITTGVEFETRSYYRWKKRVL